MKNIYEHITVTVGKQEDGVEYFYTWGNFLAYDKNWDNALGLLYLNPYISVDKVTINTPGILVFRGDTTDSYINYPVSKDANLGGAHIRYLLLGSKDSHANQGFDGEIRELAHTDDSRKILAIGATPSPVGRYSSAGWNSHRVGYGWSFSYAFCPDDKLDKISGALPRDPVKTGEQFKLL